MLSAMWLNAACEYAEPDIKCLYNLYTLNSACQFEHML